MEIVKCDMALEMKVRRAVAAKACKVVEMSPNWGNGSRVVTLHVTIDGQPFEVLWDRKINGISAAWTMSLEEIANCTCGIRHCNERFGEKVALDDEPCWFDHRCNCS